MVEVLITKKTAKPFVGTDGDEVMYFWYRAERQSDQVSIDFGSMNEYEEGEKVEVNLLKVERRNGKIGYKEIR